MISQNSVGIAKRALNAVWNGGRGAAQKSLFADNFVFRNLSSLGDTTDLDGLRQRAASMRSTYPCGRLKVQDSVGSGEVISVWWTFRDDEGCRSGQSSRRSKRELLDGTCMVRMDAGRVVEMWELGGQLVEASLT
jgi:hypothetical protein